MNGRGGRVKTRPNAPCRKAIGSQGRNRHCLGVFASGGLYFTTEGKNMRLAGHAKLGFYPAPPEAVAHAASFLRPPASAEFSMLDPCAGEGAAIRQLSETLGCDPGKVFCIELESGRADTLRANLPEATVLAPADFFGCRSSLNSFSFVWCNPPFDDDYNGGRTEAEFLKQATAWLQPGGILALVLPEDQIEGWSVREYVRTWYDQLQTVHFPSGHRKFNESVLFGIKRKSPTKGSRSFDPELNAEPGFVYDIPAGNGPARFEKIAPTEDELASMLSNSPLRQKWTAPPPRELPSPPLAIGTGHVALLLAAGHLDGLVSPEGEPPHVVRGTCTKTEYVKGETETENSDGSVTTKTTLSERIDMAVRTVSQDGEIVTYQDAGPRREVERG